MKNKTFNQLVELIAEVTGNEPKNIKADSSLDDDLGIILDDDFERLIAHINQKFDVDLSAHDLNDVIATVADLANIIDEEIELG